MDLFHAIVLAIVEGITEFLPVSSTGHLVLTSHLLNLQQTAFLKSFEIIIQLGAILAVVVLYWHKFFNFKNGIAINQKVWINVLTAFIPTGIIAFLLYDLIKNVLLGNELITVAALFVGGILLIILEKLHAAKSTLTTALSHKVSEGEKFEQYSNEQASAYSNKTIEQLSLKQCLGIGLAQSVSIIPGVSRSAASILGGMFLGANRQTAVEFSFLLAIPTMMAATGYDLLETNFALTTQEWLLLATGFFGSFIVALIVIKWFIKFVQKNTFVPFGIYRIIVAILYFAIVMR